MSETVTKELQAAFPLTFDQGNKVLQILDGEKRFEQVSAYEINPECVLHVGMLPTVLTVKKTQQAEGPVEEDLETGELLNVEDYEGETPFLFFRNHDKTGWLPLTKSRHVRIGNLKLLIRATMGNYPYGITPSAIDKYIRRNAEIFPDVVFDLVKTFIKARVDFDIDPAKPYNEYDIDAIWTIGTHFHQAFTTYPQKKYEGPPGCGKTTANITSCCLSFHPLLTPDMSDSALYRLREAACVTICLDERDFNKHTESRFSDFLNNSFTKGGVVVRIDKDRKGLLNAIFFHVFGPFSFSGVQDLPYMNETRTLIFSMKKTLKGAQYSGTAPKLNDPEAVAIRDILYCARLQFGPAIARIYEELRAEDFGVETRAWDMARPLIAVAKVFGTPEIIASIVAFVNEQVTERNEDAEERTEIKVLFALKALIHTEQGKQLDLEKAWKESGATEPPKPETQVDLALGPIKEQLLQIYPEESPDFWNNKRIGSCLRRLSFRNRHRSYRAGGHGNFVYTIKFADVDLWLRRFQLSNVDKVGENQK